MQLAQTGVGVLHQGLQFSSDSAVLDQILFHGLAIPHQVADHRLLFANQPVTLLNYSLALIYFCLLLFDLLRLLINVVQVVRQLLLQLLLLFLLIFRTYAAYLIASCRFRFT